MEKEKVMKYAKILPPVNNKNRFMIKDVELLDIVMPGFPKTPEVFMRDPQLYEYVLETPADEVVVKVRNLADIFYIRINVNGEVERIDTLPSSIDTLPSFSFIENIRSLFRELKNRLVPVRLSNTGTKRVKEGMSMVYLSNAFSLGMLSGNNVLTVTELSNDQAISLLKDGFQSAVGHQATADFIKNLTGIDIPVNRVSLALKNGDMLLVLQLQGRLPEGKVLSEDEMKQIPYKWYLVEVQ